MDKPGIPEQVEDILIVGGGPAGYTAGLYAARARMKTLMVEGESTVSQITVTDLIENYPGLPEGVNGFDLRERFRAQAESFGMRRATGDVTAIAPVSWGGTSGWRVTAGETTYDTLAVIVAAGANWRRLGVPGEEEFIGRGVSYCATCDGPFYRNRDVVVVGGGNTAVQEALYLTRFASRVILVHRRDRLRAAGVLAERASAHPKIAFAWNSVVQAVEGKDFVEGIRIQNVRNPAEVRVIPAEGVFVFIGLTPNTDLLVGIADRDANGYVRVDPDMRTSAPGIFACGDCIQKLLRQVITACGDGATAAYAAQLYVEDLKGEAY
ncbi:MAG: thioredoxin-disulfide reductase [Syntrophales bacterium]|nr:thioredoxin-disulfide reductase [Syntrophales bacterium]MDD4339718.1 thioredoxin-disulfide reductase [Syntrophales bacterium]HOG06988.1 thioredoxin-disulfide reductase [Syntrophales bacterium]HOS77311.1 thioredoxin-disulfide reductase [Syntrophales bacterium]